ncbi:Serine/threonine-protein kinase 19 [Quaeritorhiza haematococci]|nr:Serine/threonine-protein kinase 19 [Quaeritorhiza haematococci]
MCKEGKIRKFKIGTTSAFGVMLACDYGDQIRAAGTEFSSSSPSSDPHQDYLAITSIPSSFSSSSSPPGPSTPIKPHRRKSGGMSSSAVESMALEVGSRNGKVAPLPSCSRIDAGTVDSALVLPSPLKGDLSVLPPRERVAERKVRRDLFDRFYTYMMNGNYELIEIERSDLRKDIPATDDEIDQLVCSGFLTLKDATSLWISVRNAGLYWNSFSKGRNEIMNALKRKQYGEILEKQLEDKKLRNCVLDSRLIIQEMLGSGVVER